MNRSKSVPLALALTGALVALSACGGSGDTSSSASRSSGTTTVTVMTWESAETNAAIDAALAGFSSPGVQVKRLESPSGNYGDKLAALTQAKQLPDLFWCGNDTEQQYTQQGLLVDWSSRFKDGGDFGPSNFVPATIDNWKTADGKMGGLPSLVNTYGIWYDADAFAKAGVPLPKAGWTWDDMFSAASKLANRNGAKYGLVADPLTNADGPWAMSAYSVSAGGAPLVSSIHTPDKVTVDPKFAEGVGKLAASVQSGATAPPGYDASNAQAQLAAGKLPMLWSGQWLAAGYLTNKPTVKVGFAPMPVADAAKPTTIYDAVGICTPSTTKNQDATFTVLKFLNATVMGDMLKKAPVAPPAFSGAQSTYFSALDAGQLTGVTEAVRTSLGAPATVGVRPTTTYSAQIADVVTAEWGPILQGKKPLSELTGMAQQIDKVISSNR